MTTIRIHPTALLEKYVEVGEGTSIWDHVHIRTGAKIGRDCIIGGKTYIAGGTAIGDRVKINANVYIPTGVTIENGVMVAAHTVFTNDQFPRACTPDLSALRTSDPDQHTRFTLVREGATIGANCTIGNDLVIGRFAMVGMGAVVTRSVQDFHLVIGSPAKPIGVVCRCGQPLFKFREGKRREGQQLSCGHCGCGYRVKGDTVEDAADGGADAQAA